MADSARSALAPRLRHVYWLGGGSGAGKSTIAHRLAHRHGLRVYATDERHVRARGTEQRRRPC